MEGERASLEKIINQSSETVRARYMSHLRLDAPKNNAVQRSQEAPRYWGTSGYRVRWSASYGQRPK